jgi:hypothetical protein
MDPADKAPHRRLSIADAVSATSSTPAIGPTRRRIVVANVCCCGEAGVRLDPSEWPNLIQGCLFKPPIIALREVHSP